MVTARSPWRIVRTRFGAGPLLRVPALVVLLFGILVTHGLDSESAQGHFSIGAATPAAVPVTGVHHAAHEPARLLITIEADDQPGGRGTSHPGEHCAPGQPQQGSALFSACFAASARETTGSRDPSTVPGPAVGPPADRPSPVALRAASTVRQV